MRISVPSIQLLPQLQPHLRIHPPTLTEAGLNSTSFLGSGSAGLGAGLGSSFLGSAFLGSGFLGAMADSGRREGEGRKGREGELLQEKSRLGRVLSPLEVPHCPSQPRHVPRSQWGTAKKGQDWPRLFWIPLGSCPWIRHCSQLTLPWKEILGGLGRAWRRLKHFRCAGTRGRLGYDPGAPMGLILARAILSDIPSS